MLWFHLSFSHVLFDSDDYTACCRRKSAVAVYLMLIFLKAQKAEHYQGKQDEESDECFLPLTAL